LIWPPRSMYCLMVSQTGVPKEALCSLAAFNESSSPPLGWMCRCGRFWGVVW